jgi:2-methylisocitrate lyase-like PEP mutase family enzyme
VTADLRGQAAELRARHGASLPLVLANAWDAVSARVVVDAGFPVVATSSAAVLGALGFADGSTAPVDEAFAAVARIAHAVAVPVTADLEDGYGLAAEELVARLLAAGAVGCNLEDTDHHGGPAPLVDTDRHAARLAAVREVAAAAGVPIVLNGRIDVFLRGGGPPETVVDEALARAHAYREAGADCVYPIARDLPDRLARAVIEGAGGPVNLLARPEPDDVARLAGLGAARISVGAGLARTATDHLRAAVTSLAAWGDRGSPTGGPSG